MADLENGAARLDASVASMKPASRRLAYAVAVLGVLCALYAPFFVDLVAHGAPTASGGAVSYAGWGPLTAPVELAGDWRLVWRSAGPGQPAPGTSVNAPVPGRWSDQRRDGVKLPDSGAVEYRLLIRDLPPGRYQLHVPALFAATRVIVNGRVLSERGLAGASPGTTRYLVRSHEIALESDGSPLDLRIDESSYQHRDNGLEAPPVLGLSEPMSRWGALEWSRSLIVVTALMMLACYGIVVFLFRPQDRASLYFGLSCLFLAPLVAIFSHDNILLVAVPQLSFQGMLTLQYLSGIVALACFFAYTHHLFPRESHVLPYWSIQAVMAGLFVAHAAACLSGDTLAASHLSQWALPFRAAVLFYVVGIVAAAAVRRRDGAIVFLLGMGIFVVAIIDGDLVTNGLVPQDRYIGFDMRIGALLLLFSHIIILAERWSLAIEAAERTTDDLRRLLDVNISITSEMQLEALLRKIVQVTSKILHADRTSLFLHDAASDELWSMVAEGVEAREIRLPAALGLAGASFTAGAPINVRNAYEDPRFNREVDALTGYRTESVLTIPVTARDGRRLGVMQSLNHQAAAFSEGDVARMTAFAAQAAIAIDNATLFDEVAAARNYNESILGSMSTGVVTLDRQARVAKLNAAACRILAVSEEALTGADARTLLEEHNPWLMAEIDAVSASGQSKTLLDADLRNGRGDTVSANLSIVPLLNEGESAGVLILIEDISEGKRLQGAMRRFMTQNVVDQVLGRQDELLFGTACQASVLFADIRNFTSLAETLKPRETVELLNEVFTDLFEAVAASDGVLDKFMGDAIMAVYGAPLSSGRDASNAVESAVEMMRMIAALNLRRREQGRPDLRIGIGVATGEVVAGTIGSPKRMDYTVIGDSVNLASRLQALTKAYRAGVVICETTAAALDGGFVLRELDTIRVRGRQRPAKIFQVLTGEAEVVRPALDAYQRGRDCLAGRGWEQAVAAFEAAVAADPTDMASAMMLQRARTLSATPPAADWDGVWEFA